MARFVLPAVLTSSAIAISLVCAAPALAQHRPHHPAPPVMAAPSGALGATPGRRPMMRPLPPMPREPSVGRPLPGTFAGGFDPFPGRFGEVVVLGPAAQRIELDVRINAVPAIAGVRPAPVGEPVIYRIEERRARRHGAMHQRHRQSRHHGEHHRREASAGGVRVVQVAP